MLKEKIRTAAGKRLLFTRHALDQMNAAERLISEEEVREVVSNGEIIEEYSEDPRGESCLMCHRTSKMRTIHVVCSPKKDYLAIITAYIPNPAVWDREFKKRR